jgi:uncharacterized protein (DUF58 family)
MPPSVGVSARGIGVSPLGAGLIAGAGGLAAGAALLRYPELSALAASAVAAVLLAGLAVARRPRLSVEVRVRPGGVARGETASLVVTVTNLARRRSPPAALELPRGPVGDTPLGAAGELITIDVRPVPGGGRRELVLPLDTRRRGAVRFGPAVLGRADPFGLAVRRQRTGASDVLRVRPRPVPLAPLPSARSGDPDGRRAGGTPGGVVFDALREYAAGEDLRFVHWPSSARTGVLMVRQHMEPSEPAATVVLDTRPDAYPPGRTGLEVFEEAVDAAAAVALASARGSYGVVLLTTGGLRVVGRGRRSDGDTLLDELTAVRLEDGTLDVIDTLRRGGAGTLAVVTGGIDGGQLAAISRVVHRFGRVVLVRVGPRSLAAVRARERRTPADRPRLRRAAADPTPPRARVARRLHVLDVPSAADLPAGWPAADLSPYGIPSAGQAGRMVPR